MVSQPRSRQVSGSRGCGPLRLHVRDAVGPSSSNLVLVDATSHEASELGTVHAQTHVQNLSSGKLDELRTEVHPS